LTDTLYFICIDKHTGMTNVKKKLKVSCAAFTANVTEVIFDKVVEIILKEI